MKRNDRPLILIDNYDSFTFNLVAQFRCALPDSVSLIIVKNDEVSVSALFQKKPRALIIGPGPGNERAGGISSDCLSVAAQGWLPILGVCLGHQLMGAWSGARVVRARYPIHGKTSLVHHRGGGLFAGLPNPCTVARYHSLVLSPQSIPQNVSVDAWTEEGEIMAIHHKDHPWFGVQFHPESFLSEGGDRLIKSFIELSLRICDEQPVP